MGMGMLDGWMGGWVEEGREEGRKEKNCKRNCWRIGNREWRELYKTKVIESTEEYQKPNGPSEETVSIMHTFNNKRCSESQPSCPAVRIRKSDPIIATLRRQDCAGS